MKNEWTEAHQREALRRTYEIAAELVGAGREERAAYPLTFSNFVQGEHLWREWLANAGRDPRRRDREVRRVDKLARGVLVRETIEGCRIAHENGGRSSALFATREVAEKWLSEPHVPVTSKVVNVRVTRIRKAAP